jgi:hypothetical protein
MVQRADLALRRMPFIGSRFAWWRMAHLYPVEVGLLRGEAPPSSSQRPSVLHFSVNRAATQFVKNTLTRAATDSGITPVSLHEVAFWTDMPFLDQASQREMELYQRAFRPKGYLYSAFGGFVRGIQGLDQYRTLLVVRDPRDVLTSRYFSTAFSHMAPGTAKRRGFREARLTARHLGIDRWVVEASDACFEVFETYRRELVGRPNVHVARYEDMVADYPAWLDSVLRFCGLEVARTRDAIDDGPSPPAFENHLAHKRQVTPGDSHRKLQPSTLEMVTERFGTILSAFGYSP